jgi:hypothetical protein
LEDIFQAGDFVINSTTAYGISSYIYYPIFFSIDAIFSDSEYAYWWVLASDGRSRSVANSNYTLVKYRMKL